MVRHTRARSADAKEARRDRILDEATALLRTTRYPTLTLADLAGQVGLTKAALFAYFPTKEALFLEVYERQLGDWLTTLARHLQLGGTHSPQSLASLITTLALECPALLQLIPLLAGLLEHNISPNRALQHKRWLATRLDSVTPLLEAALPGPPVGGGARLLTYTQALIAGLQPMSAPAPAVHAALTHHGLDQLHVSLAAALQESLEALYLGLCHTRPAAR